MIITEISGIQPNLVLQMSFKAINNFMGLNGLAVTLLVFGLYLRMTEQDTLSSSIIQGAMAMQNAMDEIQKCTAL